jgi:cyclin A
MNTHTSYEFRLLGAAAVYVAAKYEDGQRTVMKLDGDKIAIYGQFATKKEVLDMERHMVAALGYQLGGPTAHTFVSRFTMDFQGEEELKIQRLAHLLADQSLLNYACLGYLPSVVAASALFLARFVLNPTDIVLWTTAMQELTGCNTVDLAGCMSAMFFFSHSFICNLAEC